MCPAPDWKSRTKYTSPYSTFSNPLTPEDLMASAQSKRARDKLSVSASAKLCTTKGPTRKVSPCDGSSLTCFAGQLIASKSNCIDGRRFSIQSNTFSLKGGFCIVRLKSAMAFWKALRCSFEIFRVENTSLAHTGPAACMPDASTYAVIQLGRSASRPAVA